MPSEGGAVREVRLGTRCRLQLHVGLSSGGREICGRGWGAGARRMVKQSTGSVGG
jgi:hypothetical protein